jgi:DNA-binding transcriptional regulator YiaG
MSQGERIKKIRQNLNLSQEDFGKLFEIQKHAFFITPLFP